MKRVLLIFAMMLSLWPLGAIAAVALTDNTSDATTTGESQSATDSAASETGDRSEQTSRSSGLQSAVQSVLDPDCRRLKKLVGREHHLLTVMNNTAITAGHPVPSLQKRAGSLVVAFDSWRVENDPRGDRGLRRFALARERLAVKMGGFAGKPSQESLNQLNSVIAAANQANGLRSAYCTG